MDKPITYDELMKVTRCLMRAVANALIENEATQAVMMEYDPHKPTIAMAIHTARQAAQENWKPLLDTVSEVDLNSLEDMLRKFEGPPE